MANTKTPNGKVRYAVVGAGYIAQVAVLPGFAHAENSELAALVSGDPVKHQELHRKYPVSSTYSYEQYDECLESGGIDAVYISLPNHIHCDYAIRAARAGVHVLVEKPMAVTEEECRRMIAAARESGVKLMVAYRLHFEEGNLEAVRLVRSGEIGEPRFFTSRFSQQVVEGNIRVGFPIEKGGGTVYDLGTYCINAARYLFEDEPVQVSAFSANNGEKRFQGVDEMTSVLLRFPQERLAQFTTGFGAADTSTFTIAGTKGSLTLDPAYEYSAPIVHYLSIGGAIHRNEFAKRDQFGSELLYFSDCILENREPEPSGLEGLADVRVIEAAYRSAREGKTIELPHLEGVRRPAIGQNIYRPAVKRPDLIHARSPSGEP